MTVLKKNIIANLIGSIWQAIMGLVFVPFYIKLVGIESWGLIGFFATLLVIFGLFDFGLSSTINREMARLSVQPDKEQHMRNLVRTLEIIYWTIACFVGITIALASPFFANHWIKAGTLSLETVQQAVLIMGLVIALQMPIGFYSGALMGLQKQVLLNTINVGMSTLRGAGALFVLWFVSPTIQAFFLWQIIVSALQIFLLIFFLWRQLPVSGQRAVFEKQLLKDTWRFATGMSGISIFAVILTQLDKVMLSKMLSLEMFGYYMLASMVAMSLACFFTPVFSSVYPRFTQLFSMGNEEELRRLYHQACQFMAVLILPMAIVIALFSYEIILIWTQNPITAQKTHLLVTILVCGTALNGLMYLPYALQLAFGWTKLSILKNIAAVILYIPLIIYMTKHFGTVGAATMWLCLNAGYVIFEIPIMHRRLLREEKWRWYWQDVTIPLCAGLGLAGLARLFIREIESQAGMIISLIGVLVLTIVAILFSLPAMRSIVINQLLRPKLG